ncbi:MAG: hypothetical protein WCA08_03855 [Desulfoferrobacter sp.]
MFCIKLIALFAAFYSILFITGYGLSSVLCKQENSQYKLLLAPIIGSIILSITPIYFSMLGIETLIASWILLLGFSLISLIQIIKGWASLRRVPSEHMLLFVCVVVTLIPAFVIILKAGFLTSILDSYSLFVTAPADYLIHNPFSKNIPLNYDKPITNLLNEVLGNKEYFGFFFLISSMSSYTGIPPYKLYLALSSVVGSLVPISLYVASIAGFNATRRQALAVALLGSVNYGYYVWPVIGQMPITLGIVYLILVMGYIPAMCSCNRKSDYMLYSILIAGLFSVYWILLSYALAAFLLYYLIGVRSLHPKLHPLTNGLKLGVGAFLVNPFMFVFVGLHGFDILKVTSHYTNNIPRYPYLEEIFGFGQHFTLTHNWSIENLLLIFITLTALAFVCAGFYERTKAKDYLFLSIFALVVGGLCFFRSIDFAYHFYKHSIIGIFILIASLVFGVNYLGKKLHFRVGKVVIGVSFAAILITNVMTFARFTSAPHPVLSESLVELQRLSNKVPGDSLVLINSHWPTEEAWLSFFLRDRKLKLNGAVEPWGFWILAPFSGKPDPHFFFDPYKDNIDYTLTPEPVPENDIVKTVYTDIVYDNGGYFVSKQLPIPYLLRGWNGLEWDGEYVFRRMDETGSVIFGSSELDSLLHIKGYIPLPNHNSTRVAFTWNGDVIASLTPDQSRFAELCLISAEHLRANPNILRIYSEGLFTEKRYQILEMRPGLRVESIDLFPIKNAFWNNVDIGAVEYDKFLKNGWYAIEIWGTGTTVRWVNGRSASLDILANKTEGTEMELRAQPFTYPGSPKQEMSVYVNGDFIATCKLESNNLTKYLIKLPPGKLKNGVNSVELTFRYCASPSDVLTGSIDTRSLSVAFDYIKLINNEQNEQK